MVVVNLHANTLVSGPDIHARGFAEDDSVFDVIRPDLVQVLERAITDGVEDTLPAAATGAADRSDAG